MNSVANAAFLPPTHIGPIRSPQFGSGTAQDQRTRQTRSQKPLPSLCPSQFKVSSASRASKQENRTRLDASNFPPFSEISVSHSKKGGGRGKHIEIVGEKSYIGGSDVGQ